jgi:putative inorganic carbon (hco3(-)) transporter
MGLVFVAWLLVSLLSVAGIGKYPLWALGFGCVGGIGIGIWLYCVRFRRKRAFVDAYQLSPFLKYDLYLSLPLLMMLFFSSRFSPIVSLATAVVLLCFAGYRKWVGASNLNPLNFSAYLILFLSATLGLYASPDFQRSAVDVSQLAAGIGFFYVLVNVIDTDAKFWNMIMGLMFVGAVLGGLSIFIIQTPPVKLPILASLLTFVPDILPRFANPNYVAGVLVMFFFLPFGYTTYHKGRRVFGGMLLIGVALGVLLTQSRSAIVGLLAVLLIMVGIRFKRIGYWALFLLLGVGWLFWGATDLSLGSLNIGGEHHTLEGRLELWQRAIYIVQDFSLTGIGLHTFSVVLDLFYPLFVIGPDSQMPHAHNFFLQIAVDMGMPGFVAFWMLLGAWGCIVWELFRSTVPKAPMAVFRPIVLGLAGGVMAHLIYGLTDTIALGEKAGIVLWVNLALTVSLWQLIRAREGSVNS